MAVDDSYTKVLLHMNGADASTTFTDESGKTWTVYDNSQIDTAQSVFGGASGLWDGTGDYISTPFHNDFDVGAGEWTIDFRLRVPTIATMQIMGCRNGGGFDVNLIIEMESSGVLTLHGGDGSSLKTVSTSALSANTWYHVAFSRSGNTVMSFIDGVKINESDWTGFTVGRASDVIWTVGQQGNLVGTRYNGWIDELRFSKGVARWNANFTPPTNQYYQYLTANVSSFTLTGIALSFISITGSIVLGAGSFILTGMDLVRAFLSSSLPKLFYKARDYVLSYGKKNYNLFYKAKDYILSFKKRS